MIWIIEKYIFATLENVSTLQLVNDLRGVYERTSQLHRTRII